MDETFVTIYKDSAGWHVVILSKDGNNYWHHYFEHGVGPFTSEERLRAVAAGKLLATKEGIPFRMPSVV